MSKEFTRDPDSIIAAALAVVASHDEWTDSMQDCKPFDDPLSDTVKALKASLFAPCRFCLQPHSEEAGCKCARCSCGLHPQFIRTALIDGKPNVICPRCDDGERASN